MTIKRPTWINDDGSHAPSAHTAHLNEQKAQLTAQAAAIQEAMRTCPGTPKARAIYLPHPEGSAHTRWVAAGGNISFNEWCIENVDGRTDPVAPNHHR